MSVREHRVRVSGLPHWLDAARLLGDGPWEASGDARERAATFEASLGVHEAADVQARLRKLGLGGNPVVVVVEPALPRSAVRAARGADAARRRETTPGFTSRAARASGESRFSLTPEALAMAMAERAAGRAVVDVCAGAGGNAIAFARAGCRVHALEPDPERRAELRHNVRVYRVERRVSVHPEPLEEVAAELQGDLLFADPPWGGEYDRMRADVADLPLLPVVLGVAPRFRETWLKLPPSFDVASLPDGETEAVFGEAPGDYRRVKFLWVRMGPSKSE